VSDHSSGSDARTASGDAPAGAAPWSVPTWLDRATQWAWRLLVLLVAVAGVVTITVRLSLVTLPIIIALIISTLAVPPARRLERRGLPRIVAAGIVVIGGISAFVGFVVAIAPAFVRQGRALVPTVLEAADTVLAWLEEGPLGYPREELTASFGDLMGGLQGPEGADGLGALTTGVATQVGTIAMGIGRGLTALLLSLVLLFFFVKDGEQLVGWFIRRTPDPHRDLVRALGKRGWLALAGYVRGTAAVAAIDAIGIGIGLAILRVPLVLPLSVLVFIGGFIPVIGAFLTGLLAVLVALAAGGPTTALIVLAIVVAVQQVESSLLQPTIMRRAVRLHPVVVLSVLAAGTLLVGIAGAFLAVPIAAVLAAVGNEFRLRQEAARLGRTIGPEPLGGPGIDPDLLLPSAPGTPDGSATRTADGTADGAGDGTAEDPARG
jgi:predicted PurR-regulated permease PerM